MADDEFDDSSEGAINPELVRDMRRQLREAQAQAKAAQESAEKAAGLERELAFTKALGDTKHPGLAYFVKGYDGPLEAEAIRAAAEAAGFVTGQQQPIPQATQVPQPSVDAYLAQQARSAQAMQGAATPSTGPAFTTEEGGRRFLTDEGAREIERRMRAPDGRPLDLTHMVDIMREFGLDIQPHSLHD